MGLFRKGKKVVPDEREAELREAIDDLRSAGFAVDCDWTIVHFLVFPDGASAVRAVTASIELPSRRDLRVRNFVCEDRMIDDLIESDDLVRFFPPNLQVQARQTAPGAIGEHLVLIVTLQPLDDPDGIFALRNELVALAVQHGGRYDEVMMAQ